MAEFHRTLGKLVHEWAFLEEAVAFLVFDLCKLETGDFEREDADLLPLLVLVHNNDLRANIAAAKALVLSDQFPDHAFAERLTWELNQIGNELRNERNRFVHDRWRLNDAGKFIRLEMGAKTPREPGTGKPFLALAKWTEYNSIEDIETLAEQVCESRDRLALMRNGLAALKEIAPRG